MIGKVSVRALSSLASLKVNCFNLAPPPPETTSAETERKERTGVWYLPS